MAKRKRGTMLLSTLVEASPNAIAEIEQSLPHAMPYIDCSPACGEWYTSTHEGVDTINTICNKIWRFSTNGIEAKRFQKYVLQAVTSVSIAWIDAKLVIFSLSKKEKILFFCRRHIIRFSIQISQFNPQGCNGLFWVEYWWNISWNFSNFALSYK